MTIVQLLQIKEGFVIRYKTLRFGKWKYYGRIDSYVWTDLKYVRRHCIFDSHENAMNFLDTKIKELEAKNGENRPLVVVSILCTVRIK